MYLDGADLTGVVEHTLHLSGQCKESLAVLANNVHFKGNICIRLQKNHHFICLTLMI